jgi:hypothetical protein
LRDLLAQWLWPDVGLGNSRNNLKQRVYRLRRKTLRDLHCAMPCAPINRERKACPRAAPGRIAGIATARGAWPQQS